MTRRFSAILLLLSLVLVVAAVAFRPFLQPENPNDLSAVIAWLALGPGAVWIAGKALSFLLEEIPGWGTALSGRVRSLIVLALACGVAVGAYFLQQQSNLLLQLDPWYKLAFLIVTTWASTQVTYADQKVNGLVTR